MFFLLLVYIQNSKLAMLIWNCICRPATFVQLSLSDVSRCDVESQHHVGIDGKRRGKAYSPDCYGATVREEPEERYGRDFQCDVPHFARQSARIRFYDIFRRPGFAGSSQVCVSS